MQICDVFVAVASVVAIAPCPLTGVTLRRLERVFHKEQWMANGKGLKHCPSKITETLKKSKVNVFILLR